MAHRQTYAFPRDPSWAIAQAEERRLCEIVDSPSASEDEKYQAILDLAEITGVLEPLLNVA